MSEKIKEAVTYLTTGLQENLIAQAKRFEHEAKALQVKVNQLRSLAKEALHMAGRLPKPLKEEEPVLDKDDTDVAKGGRV
jgi:hypothetical protein